ncbi:MAG: hypothetical protein FJ096_06835 [Deltaproteobacteria bacterium]|nr:hypothetical protein [Deltaproteobacteria bacterium]
MTTLRTLAGLTVPALLAFAACNDPIIPCNDNPTTSGGGGASSGEGGASSGEGGSVGCPETHAVCAGVCTDVRFDPSNCGGCGTACDDDEVCSNGKCKANCGLGLTKCEVADQQQCVDTKGDVAHCGGCNEACVTVAANAEPTCAKSACGWACKTGFGDCNAEAGDGCEAEFATSLDHCGGCGNACAPANADAACVDGACGIKACMPGYADCNLDAKDGCEAILDADPAHCGQCGNACSPGLACTGGKCLGGPCDADGDGYLATGDVCQGNDCDDRNAVVHPGAAELCDGWDNDCDGTVSELVAAWSFEQNLQASAGGVNFQNSGATFEGGACGSAIKVENGSYAYADDPGALSAHYATTKATTVAFWGKPTNCNVGGGDRFCPYISKGDSGPGQPEDFVFGTSAARDSSLHNRNWGDSNNRTAAANHETLSGWHAFVGTVDLQASAMTLYLDGKLLDDDKTITKLAFPKKRLTIGTNPAGGYEYGNLSVDELRIYSCALPASYVAAHHACGGCGCSGATSPCATGEVWNGTACTADFVP